MLPMWELSYQGEAYRAHLEAHLPWRNSGVGDPKLAEPFVNDEIEDVRGDPFGGLGNDELDGDLGP